MCGSDHNEALGLPSGSVRAILTLIIVPPIILSSIALMILMFIQNQYSSALGILSGLTGITGTIVGYYFGTKSAEKASKAIIKAHDQEIVRDHERIVNEHDRIVNERERAMNERTNMV